MSTRTVRDIMTSDVTSVHADTPFKRVVWTLTTQRISGVPVVDADGAVIGVVSETDLLPKQIHETRAAPWPFSSRKRRSRARKATALLAGEVMSTPAVTVTPDTPLSQAAAILVRHRVKRLPVVGRAGRLVGVLSRRDALRAFLRPDNEIAREIERDVIRGVMCTDPAAVQIRVRDGVVTLSGQLERRSMVACTEVLTRALDGVVAVINRLTFAVDDNQTQPTVYIGGTAPRVRIRRP